jgi:hypothetical protein
MCPVFAEQTAGFEASLVVAETVEDCINHFDGQLQLSTAEM